MFETIVNEYLENTTCKDWTIIGILEYVKSKSQISTNTIESLKAEIYSILLNFRDTHNIHIHENAKNKARKLLTNFNKTFFSSDVKNFIDELELKDERREFHLVVRRNVTSANTLEALEEHCSTRKEIEKKIRNTNVVISVDDESGQDNEKEKGTLENVRKRSYAETGNLYSFSHEPSAYIILIMKKYSIKQTTSKFDLAHSYILDLTSESQIEKEFEPRLWAELIADRPATAKPEYHKEIKSICDHLFGPLCKKKQPNLHESREKWENLRNLKAPEYHDDLSYKKEDWKKILHWAERAVGSFLDAFESEYNPIQQNDCGEREWFGDYIIPIFKGALKLNTSCRVPWGEVTVIATTRRRNQDRNSLEYLLERGHLADLLCKINQQEVFCGLGCGGPHKYDLTKWNSDQYQLPRMLKDMLDDMLKRSRSRNRCTSNLYTIGIQQYMTEIRIYMMEKRDVYRLHHLKSFNLPLSYSSYGNLRLALSWAWDIKCLVENLSFEFYDETFVTSTTPKRDPPDEMKTDTTPERSRKKKFDKFVISRYQNLNPN